MKKSKHLTSNFINQIKIIESIITVLKPPVLVIDASLNLVCSNNAFNEIFSPNETFDDHLNLKDIELFNELFEKLENSGFPNVQFDEVEFQFSGLKSQRNNFLISINALEFNEEENLDLFLISFEYLKNKPGNITATTSDLVKIQEILSQAPAMMCILRGKDYIFELANENYMDSLGKRDIIGKPLKEVLPEAESQGFVKILNKVYETRQPYIGEEQQFDFISEDNTLQSSFLDFVYQPILDTDNTVTGVFVHAIDVTDNVLARKKLEENEKELRSVIDAVPAVIWITTPDGKQNYLNKRWYEITGQQKHESQGFGWVSAMHPDDREHVKNLFISSNKKQVEWQTHIRLRDKNGNYRWMIDGGRPRWNDAGEYAGQVGNLVDVHDEKLKEQVIRDKEHRIQNIIEQATVATGLYTGADMRVEMANDAMIKLWGKDHSVIGLKLRDALPELEGQPFHDLLHEVFTTGKTYWGKEDRVDLLIDGKMQTGYYNFTYKALRDENGEIYGILNMAMDVTDMVNSKEQIRKSEIRFRQLADLMPEKVANTDHKGNFTYFNQGWLEFTGFTRDELVKKDWGSLIHPNEKKEFEKNWHRSLDSGADFEMEFRYLNKKGKYKWHLTRAEAVSDENGNTQMWIITATEIQKLKAEEKRKEDFLKMVSHELKTPITSVRGYVQLLLNILKRGAAEDLPVQSFQTYLERVDYQVGRLTRLISEMLDVSRIEKNKMELRKEKFSLNKLVEETVQDIRYTNTEHNIEIMDKFQCDVFGDKDRIGQVIINLLNNSIKYSPFSFEIEVKIVEIKNNRVAVKIKDNGIGISEENQKKIFKRFYRVDGNNEETYSGFGIGLYLAKEIIDRHDGNLKVKSKVGEWSEFSIILDIA